MLWDYFQGKKCFKESSAHTERPGLLCKELTRFVFKTKGSYLDSLL